MLSKYGILLLLAAIAITHGRPTSTYQQRMKKVRESRKNSLKMKNVRPCQSRKLEVKADLLQYGEIHSDPHYIPECTKNGTYWRQAQCDHHDTGSCFCVHIETGEIQEHTRDKNLHKEGLSCDNYSSEKGHDGHQCLHMQEEFSHKQEEYGLHGLTPLFYYPECTEKGQFKALQRNDRTFFCVDTSNGEMIPDTETQAGKMPPLTEQICSAYDQVWQEWKTTTDIEKADAKNNRPVTKASCKPGFIYTDCGCPVECTHETTAETSRTCVCKQACVCPDGKFDLDGKCVTLEECNEAKPPTTLLQAEKLMELAPATWKTFYQQKVPAILESFSVGEMEELVYEGGPVAYDQNPNPQRSFFQPPPEGEFRDGEPIPGGEEPSYLTILRQGYPDEEEQEYMERTFIPEEEYPVEEEPQNIPEENGYFPEENGYFPVEEPEWEGYPEEENERETSPEEEGNIRGVPPEENYQEEEESYTHQRARGRTEEPEEIEPENEIDERRQNERTIEHQIEEGMEFSSVPRLRDEEMIDHQTPPCDENEIPPPEGTAAQNEEEAAVSEINRVLSENGILVEATFNKESPSIKKNNQR